MALKTGILTLADLLANTNYASTVDLAQVNEVLQADLAVHNAIMRDMLEELAQVTDDSLVGSGTGETGEMIPIDEFSQPPTQKVGGSQNLGFPLEGFGYAIGWTKKFFERSPVSELARQSLAAQKAHRKKVIATIKRAIFQAANYTFYDHLVKPQISIAVKRFLNADGWTIADGPNGEVFVGASHTHYLGNATLTDAALLSLVNTVAEHGYTEGLRLVISTTDETAVRALVSFKEYRDDRLSPGTGAVANQTVDRTKVNNRAIGIFGLAEVWTKPWAIASYPFVYSVDTPDRPLAYRTRSNGADGLRIVAEMDSHPLHAQQMEAEFGFAVKNRANGAVLYTANAVYSNPAITG